MNMPTNLMRAVERYSRNKYSISKSIDISFQIKSVLRYDFFRSFGSKSTEMLSVLVIEQPVLKTFYHLFKSIKSIGYIGHVLFESCVVCDACRFMNFIHTFGNN